MFMKIFIFVIFISWFSLKSDENKRQVVRRYAQINYVSGVATGYGLDGPGIESRWGGKIFCTRPDRPWGPRSLLYNVCRVFPGGKTAGVWCWPPTPIWRRGWRKSSAIHLLPLWAFVACYSWALPLPLPLPFYLWYWKSYRKIYWEN